VRSTRIGFGLLILIDIAAAAPVPPAANLNFASHAAVAAAMPQDLDNVASVSGTVADGSGKPIAGATVSIKNAAGVSQTAKTDTKGKFWIGGLAAGAYTITAVAKGFKNFEVAGIALAANDAVPLDVLLEPGESAAAPAQEATPAQAPQSQNLPWLEVTPMIPPPPPGATPPSPAQTQPAVNAPVVKSGGKTATITGTVSDQTGAVLPDAAVVVSNASGFKQTATSNAQGIYAVSGLPPGAYDLSVSKPNFKLFQTSGLQLAAGVTLPIDMMLEPAGEKTEVNVSAGGAAQVKTENAEVSGTITEKEVTTLGLNGRNFTQLITLTPGVSNQTSQDEAKVGVQGSVKYSVNGGRVEYNSFEVDGSDVLNAGLSGAESTLVVYPSLDAIQEVKVLTSNYGAQYGRTASGTVEVTTKSGTSHWHGGAYEFIRNEIFNARNYFDQTTKVPTYRRNDFGGYIGGPLWIPGLYNPNKDKTFVFFSEEARIEKSPNELRSDFNHAVPTVAERQGNFSDVCPNPFDPQDAKQLVPAPSAPSFLFKIASFPDCPGVPVGSGAPAGYRELFYNHTASGTTYNNLAIQTVGGGLDPNALAILNQNLIPLPNSYTGCNSSLVGQIDHTTLQPIEPCYDAVISLPTHWHEELFRIDHNFSPKLLGTFRYIHDSWNTVTPTPNWGTVVNTFPTVQNKFVGPGVDMLVRLTQTITSSLLNETTFSYTDSHITLTTENGPGGANYQRPAGLGNPAEVGCRPAVSHGLCVQQRFWRQGPRFGAWWQQSGVRRHRVYS